LGEGFSLVQAVEDPSLIAKGKERIAQVETKINRLREPIATF
jgi:hypothetical protein